MSLFTSWAHLDTFGGGIDPDATPSDPPPRRIVIEHPAPALDGGAYPIKRCVGDLVQVAADIFRDGHDRLRTTAR